MRWKMVRLSFFWAPRREILFQTSKIPLSLKICPTIPQHITIWGRGKRKTAPPVHVPRIRHATIDTGQPGIGPYALWYELPPDISVHLLTIGGTAARGQLIIKNKGFGMQLPYRERHLSMWYRVRATCTPHRGSLRQPKRSGHDVHLDRPWMASIFWYKREHNKRRAINSIVVLSCLVQKNRQTRRDTNLQVMYFPWNHEELV